MKNKFKIYTVIFSLALFSQTKNAKAEASPTQTQLRACYQSSLDEASSEEDSDQQRGSFTIEDIENPDTFFADCETIDYEIIKEMYVEYYNSEKLNVSTDYHSDYDQYKQHVNETIDNLKIDFKPEDLSKLDQWEPFANATQSIRHEYDNRLNSSFRSKDYINDLYSVALLFNKIDDSALGNYAYNYLTNISENKCSIDCEIVFDFFKNILSNRPEALKKLLVLSRQHYDFIFDNIELGYRSAEIKRQTSKRIKDIQLDHPKNFNSNIQSLEIKRYSNPKTICEQIKHIPVAKNCRSAQFILNKLITVDLVADEIWSDIDQCENTLVLKTSHLAQPLSKNNKMKAKENLSLIIQVFNDNSGYVFNKTWLVKSLQDLKNQCSAL